MTGSGMRESGNRSKGEVSSMTTKRRQLGLAQFLMSYAVTALILGFFMIGMTMNVSLTGATLFGFLVLGGFVGLPVMAWLQGKGRLNKVVALILGGVLGLLVTSMAAWAPGLGVPFYSEYAVYGVAAGLMSMLNWPAIGAFAGALMGEQIERRARKLGQKALAADGAPKVGE